MGVVDRKMIVLSVIPYPFPWGLLFGAAILLGLGLLSYFHEER